MQDLDGCRYRSDYIAYCEKLKGKTLFRKLANNSYEEDVINFATNDYLALSQNADVISAARNYTSKWGTSSKSSRLIDNPEIFSNLERKIALSKNSEDALILNSGFVGNVTVIAALLNKQVFKHKPIVFSDKLIHSSMHIGIHISGALHVRYRHLDLNHLESLLKENRDYLGPKFIFSETIFSMDGDVIDLEAIIFLAKKYNAFLYIDESHDIGMLGDKGYGITSKYTKHIDCILGSFSKAIGSFGGYVICSKQLKEYLVNKCAGLIYSVALPPMIIGAIEKAWDLLPTLNKERDEIIKNTNYLLSNLCNLGLNTGNSSTHIVPIILEKTKCVLTFQQYLKDKKIIVSAIRPPSVSPNTSRIKLSVCSGHNKVQIDHLISSIKTYEQLK